MGLDISDWLDKYGGLHLHPNPDPEQSENSPMYSALLAVIEKVLGRNDYANTYARFTYLPAIYDSTAPSRFRPTPVTKKQDNNDYDMSHDNMTGVIILGLIVDEKEDRPVWVNRVPVLSKQRIHPRDMLYYALIKYPALFEPLLIPRFIVSLTMIISCLQLYKTRGGYPILKTDGKLLTFMRCHAGRGWGITWAICDFIITDVHWKKFPCGWSSVSRQYFKDWSHPINKLMNEFEIGRMH